MKISTVLLIIVILLALILRIYGINWGLPSKDYYFSHHSDEVHYIRGLSQMNPMKLDFNPHYFNWGTWHFYELGAIIGMAGFLNIVKLNKDKYFYYSHPYEMSKIYLTGRFLSVLFALATIFLIYLIGKKIYGEKTGLLASFFLAINPAHIVHSHYLKADTSVTFWVTLVLLCGILLIESGRLKFYILTGIFSGFAIGSQQNGLCFLATILFAHLLREFRISYGFRQIKEILTSKKLWIGFAAIFITYLIISPYLYLSPKEFISGIQSILYKRMGINPVDRYNIILDTLRAFNIGMNVFFVILSSTGIIFALIYKTRERLLVVFWVIPYLLIMIVMGALNTRHQMLVYPGLLLLAAGTIKIIYSRMNSGYLRTIFILFITLSSLYTLIYSYAYDRGLARKMNVQQEASEWIISNIPPETRIGIFSQPEIRNYPAIIHQNYYYNDNKRFKIINLNSEADNLKREQPEYIVFRDREGLEHNRLDPFCSLDFITEVRKEYKIVKVFERYPSFLGLTFRPSIFVDDWEIPFPVINILRKYPNLKQQN